MKFRILGSGSSVASHEHSQACIWLEEEQILLDCGEGSTAKLNSFNLTPKIRAVVISHFHPDHVIGLYTLLQNMHISKRTETLTIYLPESIEEFKQSLRMFYLDLEKFKFKCKFKLVEDLTNDLGIIPIPNLHLKKSYSFYVPTSGFIYSADVNSLEFLKHVDNKSLIVLDGLHPEAEEILKLGDDTEIRIILTHGLSQKLEKKITKTNRFEIADENKKYNF